MLRLIARKVIKIKTDKKLKRCPRCYYAFSVKDGYPKYCCDCGQKFKYDPND